MKKCVIMFIFLLLTILFAMVTEKAPEIQVDEMLLADENVSNDLLIVNKLGD